ncbi:B-box domain protein 30-like [Trifolium pratense]|uniref:B-box domain protein 30-like n=1 Tax=Trifolium pratense TaxID=57577 RepID=UPI001E69452D|nr:B-box domain protein 30-like [Trifolium pratense]
MKKKCELCKKPAKLFCESDQASLCWECDAKVHTANFIVTKHHRFLLCHICQSLTPWHGTGPKFVPTISLCNHCVSVSNNNNDHHHHHDDDDDQDEDIEDEDDADDEDEENQVVPWKSTPPPSVSSSSSYSATSTTNY